MREKIQNFEFSVFNYTISPKKLISHPLFSGSAIMMVGSNFGNFVAYLYHLVVGRMMGPVGYGELAAMISVIGLLSTSFNFFSTVIVKFVSSADEKYYSPLLRWFEKWAIIFGAFFSLAVLLASGNIAQFLHVDRKYLVILSPFFLLSILMMLYKSFLQGLLKFTQSVISNNFDLIMRFILTIAFVYFGYSVGGAVVAFPLTAILGVILLKYFLRDYANGSSEESVKQGKEILVYAIPIFVSSFAAMSVISTDIVLVKHFFDAHQAGIYASVATLGKIIFYGTAPIAAVMFPLVSKRHSKGHGYKKIVVLSLVFTAGVAGGVTLIYKFFPKLMISILYGKEYIEGAYLVFYYGIFITLFSLASLLVNFYLSINKTKVVVFVFFAALLQAVGIWLYHKDLQEVVLVCIISMMIFLSSMLCYFYYERKKEN